jgi:DNA-binding response OmpR family regulator
MWAALGLTGGGSVETMHEPYGGCRRYPLALVVSEDVDAVSGVTASMTGAGFDVMVVSTMVDAEEALGALPVHAVIADSRLRPGVLELLEQGRAAGASISVMLFDR